MEKGKYLALARKYKETTGMDLDGELLFNTFEKLKKININRINKNRKDVALGKLFSNAFDTIVKDIYNKYNPHYLAGEFAPANSDNFLQELDNLMDFIYDNELGDKWKLKENYTLSYGQAVPKSEYPQGNVHQESLFCKHFNAVNDKVNELKRNNDFTHQMMIAKLDGCMTNPAISSEAMIEDISIARKYLKSLNPIKRFFQFGLKHKINTVKARLIRQENRNKKTVERMIKDYVGPRGAEYEILRNSTETNTYEKKDMVDYNKFSKEYDRQQEELGKPGAIIHADVPDTLLDEQQNVIGQHQPIQPIMDLLEREEVQEL